MVRTAVTSAMRKYRKTRKRSDEFEIVNVNLGRIKRKSHAIALSAAAENSGPGPTNGERRVMTKRKNMPMDR